MDPYKAPEILSTKYQLTLLSELYEFTDVGLNTTLLRPHAPIIIHGQIQVIGVDSDWIFLANAPKKTHSLVEFLLQP